MSTISVSWSVTFQYQPLHEGLPSGRWRPGAVLNFNTSPSTRGFRTLWLLLMLLLFQYQPLHEGLRTGK